MVGQFNLSWPQGVVNVFTVTDSISSFSLVNGGFGSALDCSFRPYYLPIPMFNMFVSLALLVGSAVTMLFYWNYLHPFIMLRCLKHKKKNSFGFGRKLRSRRSVKFLISVITLWYMMYSSCARQGFAIFSCTKFSGEDVGRLRNALDIECYVGEHRNWLLFLGE